MSAALVKELRERTGTGILQCKDALKESGNDVEKAIDWLKINGILKSESKAQRTTNEGLVYSYIHHTQKLGVMLELNCETDFAAATQDFKDLAYKLSLHIAAVKPLYISRQDIPDVHETREREVNKQKISKEGKSEQIAARIIEGRMNKFYEEICLLEQKYVMDETISISDLIKSYIAKLGENIKLSQFSLFVIGK